MTKTALILGPTGGIGRLVARRLAKSGWLVRALHRAPESVNGDDPFEWIKGNALIAEDVARAARGVHAIVHAVKPRHYQDWHSAVLPMIDNTLAAANGARVVIPGNVYNYGPDAGALIREDAPQHPMTRKGRLRVEMEMRIAKAVELGNARALILRAGDFFGPGATSSWFSEAMVKPGKPPKYIYNPAKPGAGHQWVYLPDLAETMAQLMDHQALPPFARFHMDGHWDPDGNQMAGAIARALGSGPIDVRRVI